MQSRVQGQLRSAKATGNDQANYGLTRWDGRDFACWVASIAIGGESRPVAVKSTSRNTWRMNAKTTPTYLPKVYSEHLCCRLLYANSSWSILAARCWSWDLSMHLIRLISIRTEHYNPAKKVIFKLNVFDSTWNPCFQLLAQNVRVKGVRKQMQGIIQKGIVRKIIIVSWSSWSPDAEVAGIFKIHRREDGEACKQDWAKSLVDITSRGCCTIPRCVQNQALQLF